MYRFSFRFYFRSPQHFFHVDKFSGHFTLRRWPAKALCFVLIVIVAVLNPEEGGTGVAFLHKGFTISS